MTKKAIKIKVHEHKDLKKGASQYDIWIDNSCHIDINNTGGFYSVHNLETTAQLKEVEKLIKKYFIKK